MSFFEDDDDSRCGGFGGVPAGDGVETSIVIRRVRVNRAVPSRADPRATVVLTRRRV